MNTTEYSTMHKQAESATIDLEVTIIQGSQFTNSHAGIGKLRKPTYFVELELDKVKKQTSEGRKAENGRDWDERFVFTANRSSRLSLRLYCKHNTTRSDHVIGEVTHDIWDIPRHDNKTIDVYDAEQRVTGKITLCFTIAATVTFSAGPVHDLDLQSSYSLSQMTKIVESLSGEELDRFPPVWHRFIQSLDIVASRAQKLSELHPPVQVALGAVTFALKMVLEQIDRDRRIEKIVEIMDDLYLYVADSYPIEKITSYKETLNRLLAQTTECSYFIGNYRKVTQFAQRAVVNLVSDADAMIKTFENSFRDLKIELILGSSLQTAIVSFRVLQKVENIEKILYTNMLKPLQNVGWDSSRTCVRGTRSTVINDLVRWASNSGESGTAKNNRIHVLQGPTGCGKSSIAHSVAQAFHLQNRLAVAIFLDERTEGKVIGSQILSITIASQLAAYDQNIREAIAAKIEADASLATEADVERQFRDLIVSATRGLALIGPICIVIDGLQKIVNPAEQLKLLTAIADHFPNLPSNFRILLTSQHGRTSEDIARLMPDCSIKEISFDDEGTVVDYSEHVLQSLRHLFSKKLKLAERYAIKDLCDQFIQRSMGVPFWISTALQFLLSCAEGDECTILTDILSTELPRTKEVAMDQLFRIILTCIPAVHSICQILIQSSKPLPLQDSSPQVSVSDTSHPRYQSPILNMMHTFLIEHGTDKTNNLLFTIHPSVEDFLTSSRRCHGTTLYVDRFDPTPSLTMFDICFDSMEAGFRRNICRLDDIMVLNEEIPDKDKRLDKYIPAMLQHACRHWIFHLEALGSNGKWASTTPALQRLDNFLSNHLLHWIECMSLLGWVDIISTTLDRLTSWRIKHSICFEDVRDALITDTLQFIQAFASIISKAAMQTYLSALPLVSSTSLILFNKYSAMSRPRTKVSRPRSRRCQIIRKSRVVISTIGPTRYHSQGSDDTIALAPSEGRASIDPRIGNKIVSPAKEDCRRQVAFSPDGKWIAIENKDERALDIWSVETLSFVKTIANGSGQLDFDNITYSADGKTIMIIASCFSRHPFPTCQRIIYFWDVKTDKRMYPETSSPGTLNMKSDDSEMVVAVSSDGSQIAVAHGQRNQSILLFDVSTGDRTGQPIKADKSRRYDRLVWSPNGQSLATVNSFLSQGYKKALHLLSLSDNTEVCLIPAIAHIIGLAYSPDSSKVVAIHRDDMGCVPKLSMWCTQTGDCIASPSFNLTLEEVTVAFSHDQDILVCGYDLDRSAIVLFRFDAVPKPSLRTYTQYPPKFDPSDTPLTIAYAHDVSGVIVDYASQVDADGWILNTKGEREIWTPWTNYDLSYSCEPPQEGQTRYRTLEVMDPETKVVVLRYVIAFEQREDVDQMQEPAASLE